MLETNIRQIAIQAIAARASGSPVEAAGQILAGIAALDSPGKPFVIWPTNLPLAEQIKALESEIERIRHITQSMADYWATRDLRPQADSGAHPEPAPEGEQNEIKLIFARACAESLKETAGSILAIKDDGEKVRAAESHGSAFASAFIVVSRHFICETTLKPAQQACTDQSSSTPEAEPQQSSALSGQA